MVGIESMAIAATLGLSLGNPGLRLPIESQQAAADRDRSSDLVLRWITDPGGVDRDSVVILEIANESATAIPLVVDLGRWLDVSLGVAGAKARSLGPDTLEGGFGSNYLELRPWSQLHYVVALPTRDVMLAKRMRATTRESDELLIAKLSVDPTDVIFMQGTHPLRPGSPPLQLPSEDSPPVEYAGYRARVASPPLKLHWVYREICPDPAPIPAEWHNWRLALDSLGGMQDDGRRMLAARRAGLPEDTPAAVVSGLEAAMKEWKGELGRNSPWSNPDDLAFSLAIHRSLGSSPEIQRHLLALLHL